jgi:hypothetical protein
MCHRSATCVAWGAPHEAAVKKLSTGRYIGENAFVGTPAQVIKEM